MSKHTPGPYEANKTASTDSDGNPVILIGSKAISKHIAEVYRDDEEAQATAQMLAAAPELYIRAKAVLDQIWAERGSFTDDQQALFDVTEKAEGRS